MKIRFILPILIIIISLFFGYKLRKEILRFFLSMRATAYIFKSEKNTGELPYRLYFPKGNKNPMPLVVYFHGAAQRGNENKKQLDYAFYRLSSGKIQNEYPAFILAPQCPIESHNWLNRIHITYPYEHYEQDRLKEGKELKMTVNLIKDLQKKYSIDTNRIYLIGFSMGASATWDLITRYPDFFAAAVPIAGETDTSKANLLKNTPIWAFHGEYDEIVPVWVQKNMCDKVSQYNKNCKFTVFKNAGHGGIRDAFDTVGFIDWLFTQSKSKRN